MAFNRSLEIAAGQENLSAFREQLTFALLLLGWCVSCCYQSVSQASNETRSASREPTSNAASSAVSVSGRSIAAGTLAPLMAYPPGLSGRVTNCSRGSIRRGIGDCDEHKHTHSHNRIVGGRQPCKTEHKDGGDERGTSDQIQYQMHLE